MTKLKSTVNNIVIAKKYFFLPLLFSFCTSSILIGLILYQKICLNDLVAICSQFYSIGITFSLTFIAFSITALALLQLLQSKEWFVEVSKSIYFKRFLKRFLYSAKFCLVLFVLLMFLLVINNLSIKLYCYISLSVFLLSMFYIVFWIWNCITDFIELFK